MKTADSIMDEDGEDKETSRAKEGEASGNGNGEGIIVQKQKGWVLDMAEQTDEQAALATLESNQLPHLRLRKQYYLEVLNFIRQVGEVTQSFSYSGRRTRPRCRRR
jgi:condensin complex subunit 1